MIFGHLRPPILPGCRWNCGRHAVETRGASTCSAYRGDGMGYIDDTNADNIDLETRKKINTYVQSL